MSDEVNIKLTGTDDIISSIKALAIASAGAAMRGTLRVAEKIERQAKAQCPVDTGRLRASISTNWTGSGMERALPSGGVKMEGGGLALGHGSDPDDGVGQPQPKADTFSAVVGSNLEYAPSVEWNETAQHKMGGPHFLYGAYFAYEGDVQDEISSELGKELAKVMK